MSLSHTLPLKHHRNHVADITDAINLMIPLTVGRRTQQIGNLSSALTVAVIIKVPLYASWTSPLLLRSRCFCLKYCTAPSEDILKHHFMSTKAVPRNVKWLKREQNLTCSSGRSRNMEHLQRLRVGRVSTAARKNNPRAVFRRTFFMSSTYVTIQPRTEHVRM